MSINTEAETETHKIEANDDLIKSVIVDQTSDIESGWRESFQNIIDSDASEGRLNFDHEYTLVADNGSGVELTAQRGINLLTVMGESSKDAKDHSTIGEFGVGLGQIIAKGRTMFASGDTALMFDIKGWGLEAKTVPLNRAANLAREYDEEWGDLIDEHFPHFSHYDGLAILVDHYEDEVPDEDSYRWESFEDNVKDRFRYLNAVDNTKLYVDGDLITDSDPLELSTYGKKEHTEVYNGDDTGDVHIAVKHSFGSLTVYSGGIKVTTVDSRGLSGRIVTDKNLRLNFARNEIKSGCPIWSEIEQRLDEIREEMFTETDNDLRDDARKFVADRMFNHGEIEKYGNVEAFETASESLVSWNEITEKDEIGMALKGNPAADKLEEVYGELVLNENDPAVSKFQDERDSLEDAPSDFDAQARAESEGLHTSYEDVDESELKPTQRKKLGIARYIVSMMDDDRDVHYGESDVASAWTDGRDYIKITDSAAPASSWIEWVPQLWRVVIHEITHKGSSKSEPAHGSAFARDFRDNIEKEGGIEALSKLMGEIHENTLTEVAERGHSQQL